LQLGCRNTGRGASPACVAVPLSAATPSRIKISNPLSDNGILKLASHGRGNHAPRKGVSTMKDQALTGIRTGVSTATDAAEAAREFHAAVAQQDPAVTVFFCSPSYDRAALEMALRERFGSTPLIGCTTAGEITPRGYLDHSLTGFSLPSNAYAVATHLLSNLQSFEISQGLTAVNDLHQQLSAQELPADEGINRFAAGRARGVLLAHLPGQRPALRRLRGGRSGFRQHACLSRRRIP